MEAKTFSDLYLQLIERGVKPNSIEMLLCAHRGELLDNIVWQFLRDRVLPAQGGGVTPLRLNLGTFCAIYCAEHGAKNVWLELPRCSYVSSTMYLYSLYLNAYRQNNRINMISGTADIAGHQYAMLRKYDHIMYADLRFINVVNFIEDFERHDLNDVKGVIENSIGTTNIMWSVPLLKPSNPMVQYMHAKFEPFDLSMINDGNVPPNVHIKFYADEIHDDEYFRLNKAALPADVYEREINLNRGFGFDSLDDAEKVYLVNRFNYDYVESRHIFRDEENAEWCEKFYKEKIKSEGNECGEGVEVIPLTIDTRNFKDIYDKHIAKMEEKKRKQEEKKKQQEIAEYNRIKEKYNL